jgi:hypothetical protein
MARLRGEGMSDACWPTGWRVWWPMISTSERRVFVDACVLAHPVSRSLVLFASVYPDTGLTACGVAGGASFP